MSEQEGTPKKVRRVETNGRDQNGSDQKSAPSTPSRKPDYKSAPSTPTRQLAEGGKSNTTPVKLVLSPASPRKCGTLQVADDDHLPPVLPYIVEDVDMEDAEKAGPSRLTEDAAKSPPLDDSLEPPKSPLSKWFQELGAGLNTLSNTLMGCVKAPENLAVAESYKWVHSFRYKPFGGDEKWLGQVYQDRPPHQTHLLGAMIPDVQCFEISTRKLEKLPAGVRQKLGACVTFPKQLMSACPAAGCSRCSLYYCSACPHTYICDCLAKEEYNGAEWCPHIHVAYAKNMDVYGAEACLFIQEDNTNLTEKRHIRAMIQGPNKMCKVEPNLYMENFEYLVRSVRYNVKVNASSIPKSKCICEDAKRCTHCEACWCRYSCTCEDYWYDRQVCEHIHNVAMQERKDKIDLEKKFSFQYFKESKQIFIDKPSIGQTHREQSMMSEHELSFHIPFKYIEEVQEGHKWIMASSRDRKVACITVNTNQQTSCICKKPTTTKANMCVKCSICAYHYTCDCIHAEEIPVCRHMHALARYRQLEPIQDTYLDDKLEYYGKLISEYEKKLRFTDKMPTRRPTGVTKSCSESSTDPSSTSSSSYTSAFDNINQS